MESAWENEIQNSFAFMLHKGDDKQDYSRY